MVAYNSQLTDLRCYSGTVTTCPDFSKKQSNNFCQIWFTLKYPLPICGNGKILDRDQFIYLRRSINAKLDPEAEIKARIEEARSNFTRMRNILSDQHLDLDLRCRQLKCCVWSSLLYGVETWTLKTNSMNTHLKCGHTAEY